MCFRLNNLETPETATKIANEDIICYKILKDYSYLFGEDNGKTFKSLYQNFEYVIGEKYQQTNLSFRVTHDAMYGCYFYEVDEAFHSYKYQETALCELYDYASRSYMRFVAVKCTIPKGSKYVENDSYYASDAIMLNEIIGEFKHKIKVI